MQLSDALRATLHRTAAAMAAARDPWWIIGSAAAALHGAAPVDVADVDVLLSVRDARAILPALGVAPRPGGPHAAFRSAIFGVWRAPPLAVEFMAGFAHHGADGWYNVWPATRVAVPVDDAVVHVPERRELRAIMERFGRPKDLARARLLAALD